MAKITELATKEQLDAEKQRQQKRIDDIRNGGTGSGITSMASAKDFAKEKQRQGKTKIENNAQNATANRKSILDKATKTQKNWTALEKASRVYAQNAYDMSDNSPKSIGPNPWNGKTDIKNISVAPGISASDRAALAGERASIAYQDALNPSSDNKKKSANTIGAEKWDKGTSNLVPYNPNMKNAFETMIENAAGMESPAEPTKFRLGTSLYDRAYNALSSIGDSRIGSDISIKATAKQSYKNEANYKKALEENDEYINQLIFLRDKYPSTSAEYKKYNNMINKIYSDADSIRDTTADMTEANKFMSNAYTLREQAKSGMGDFGRDMTDALISVGDNLSSTAMVGFNPAASLALMGLSSAGQSMNELSNQGYSARDAFGRGTVSGIIEAVTEKIGVDNMYDMLITRDKNFVINMLKQALAEGTEEGVGSFMNYGADRMMGINEDFDWDDLYESVKQGFLSGLVYGAGGTAINYTLPQVGDYLETKSRVRNAITDSADDVIQTGLESAPETKSYKMAQELQAKREAGEAVTDAEVRKLYNENVKTIKAEEKAQEKNNAPNNEFAADNKNVAVNEAEQAETGYMGRSAEYTARAQAEYDKNAQNVRIADALNGMGENGKKAMAQFYKGDGNFSDYYNGFSRFYNAGLTDMPIKSVDTVYARNISSDIQYAAYMAGQNDAKLSLEREKTTATVYNKIGGVIENEYSKQLTKDEYSFYEALGKATGTKIRFNGKLSGNVNGVYSKGIIDISTDADRPIYGVIKHEITHSLQKTAPKQYREYRNYTVQLAVKYTEGATETSIIEKYRKAYAEQGVNLTTEEAMDEIAADFTEYILTDEATLRQFINDHVNDKNKRNVAQRFFDSVRNFINKVKSIFKGNKAAMDEATVNEFGATVAELEKAEKLWKDTLKATQEKTNEAKQGKISEVSVDAGNTHDVKYLIKQSSEHGLIAVLDKKIVPLDGETENQAIKRFFSENIKGKEAHIISSDEKAQFDQIGKYLYPGKPIANMNVKKDATAILIDMVSVGTNKRHSEDLFINGKKKNHSGLDATNGWDYYGTKFIIDESGTVWSGLLIIRKSKNNRDYFYDLDLIKKAGHQDVSKLLNPVRAAAYDYSKTQMTDDVKRFSLKKPVEETKNLLALHNLTEEKLKKSLQLGGFPMPSIAVTKADIPHTNFGDITLVMNKSTIDPKANKKNTVYSADAWTPTFPSIEYEADPKVQSRINKKYYDLAGKIGYDAVKPLYDYVNDVERKLAYSGGEQGMIDSLKDNTDMMNLYLADSGQEQIKPVEKSIVTRLDDDTIEKYEYLIKGLGKDVILDLKAKPDESPMTHRKAWLAEHGEELRKVNEEYLRGFGLTDEEIKNVMENPMYSNAKLLTELRGVLGYIANGAETTRTEIDGTATKEAIRKATNKKAYEQWLTDLFAGIEKSTGIYNNKDLFTSNGNRRSFKQTHYPVTLENIVKAMAGQKGGNTKNVSGFHGVKSLRAGTAERFKSIADMHKREGRLQHLTEAQAEAINNALSDRLYDIINRIDEAAILGESNSFIRADTIGDVLVEIAEKGKYTVDSIVKSFAEYGKIYKINNALAADIRDLLFDVSQMPVNIFEAKPERVVGFDEVLAAVVPDNIDTDFINRLKDAGLNVLTYKQDNEQSRLEAVNSVEGASFSLKGTDDILKENEKLKKQNEYLKSQMKLTKEYRVNQSQLERLARKFIKEADSSIDKKELLGRLNSLYTYLENAEQPVYEDVKAQAVDIAKDIISQSVIRNDEFYDNYQELKKYLRNTRITVSETDRANFPDGYNNFRKSAMGRLNLVNDGTSIDKVYQELDSLFPEYFDAEQYITAADQAQNIIDVLNMFKAYDMSPDSYYVEQSAEYLANDIIESYFDVPRQQPTFADRQAAKLEKQKYKDAVKYNRLKEQKNAELADKELAMQMHEGAKTARAERLKNAEIESIKEQSKNRLKELRKQRDNKIKAIKAQQREKEARMSEKKTKSVYMAKIRKHVDKMNKSLFKATDKNHILEPLQRPVTEFLSSINLATDNMSFKSIKQIYALQEAYKKIIESKDSNLLNIDPDLLDNLNDVITALNKADVEVVNKTNNEVTINGYNQKQVFPHSADTGIRVADMSSKDIISLYHAVLAVERSISTANKIFSENKYESISNWAEEISIETETKKSRKGRKIEAFRIDLENPYTFFSHFGDAGKAIYRMLRNAQDKQQSMTSEVAELAAKIVDRKKVRQWEREVHTFTTEHGKKLTLTTDQCMEIRLLAKRKEGYTHLTGKGVFQPEVKVGKTKVYRSTSAVLLTDADLKAISDSLTKEQIEVSDKLQSIMQTTLADYGNAASMEAYGYTKFNDPNYWPIKVASESIKSEPEKGEHNTRSIKNIGLAKNLTPEAKNPVNINGAFKTFANHAADMIDYAAWLCPMEDANRLFNYQFRDDNGITHIDDNMQGLIERVAGNGARAYWERLMEDIQNGINQTKDSAFIEPVNKIIGNAKGAAVGGNIRVVIQQPTAVFRAAVVLKPQYMMKGLMSKGGWKTALKYSPIAQRKDMGGFDMSSPMQMKEILFDDKSGLQRFNDSMTWGAGKADAVTWGKIWKACEYQIKDDHPGLKGDEFYSAVNDLFTEVIDQSQVVDGILQRSQIMRSGNSIIKQATAFMGEPIMSLNIVIRAYDNFVNETDGKKRTAARKVLGRTVIALTVTNMVNALAQSLIDAVRDDDDDKYWQKFWEAFTGIDDDEEYGSAWDKAWSAVLNGNMISGINPVGYVPFVKDILTMFQGYDVTRADADAINNVISASKMFIDSVSGEGKRTIPYATKNLVHQTSKIFGISATNILRDVWGLARTIAYESGSIEVQYEMEKAIYKIDNTSNKGRFIDILYRAYEQNDRTAFDHIIQDMIDQGIPASDIQSGLSSRAKKAGLTPDDMNNSTIKAGLNLKYEEEEKEKDYSIDDLSGREYLMYASENEDIIKGIMSDFESMGFGTLDEETANDLLRAAYTYANETALEDASGGEYEIDKDWIIAAQTAPDMLDMSLGEYLMLRDEYGDSAVSSSGIFKAYDAGIEPELYLESHDATKNMKGDPVKVNGIIQYKSDGTIKYVPYSKQNKIKDYLNTLNLTQDEYDALFELLK